MKTKIIGTTLVLALFLVSLVSATGVSFSQTIEAYPGQTLDTDLRLQNIVPNQPDMVFEGRITMGGEIITFNGKTEKDFTVESGEVVKAPIKVVIPADAAIGTEYDVRMVWRRVPVDPVDVSPGGSGIQFIKSSGIGFDIKVIEQPPIEEVEEPSNVGMYITMVLGILILLIIIAIILKKQKKKRKK